MTIDVGTEKGKTMDIRKSNGALLEMAIADIFIVKIYLLELLSPTTFARYWMFQRCLVQGSLFQVGRKLEVGYFFNSNCFKNVFTKILISYTGELLNLNFENTFQGQLL